MLKCFLMVHHLVVLFYFLICMGVWVGDLTFGAIIHEGILHVSHNPNGTFWKSDCVQWLIERWLTAYILGGPQFKIRSSVCYGAGGRFLFLLSAL